MSEEQETAVDPTKALQAEIGELKVILKNAAIVLHHTHNVYQSMAERGSYPDELVEGSPFFKQRKGFNHISLVLSQAMTKVGDMFNEEPKEQ